MPNIFKLSLPKSHLPRWLGPLVAIYILLGSIDMFLPLFQTQFLLAVDWTETAIPYDILMCFSLIALIAICCHKALKYEDKSSQENSHTKPSILQRGSYLGIAVLISNFGLDVGLISRTAPVLSATFFGQETELPFVINTVSTSENESKCAYKISLRGLPLHTDDFCASSSEEVASLKRGDAVIISGKGTKMGLFPESVRKME